VPTICSGVEYPYGHPDHIKVFRQVIVICWGTFVAAAEDLICLRYGQQDVMHVEKRLGVRLIIEQSHVSLTKQGMSTTSAAKRPHDLKKQSSIGGLLLAHHAKDTAGDIPDVFV